MKKIISIFFCFFIFSFIFYLSCVAENKAEVIALVNNEPVFQHEVAFFSRSFLLDGRKLFNRKGYEVTNELILEALILKKLLLADARSKGIPLVYPGVVLNINKKNIPQNLTPQTFKDSIVQTVMTQGFNEFMIIRALLNQYLLKIPADDKTQFLDKLQKQLFSANKVTLKKVAVSKLPEDNTIKIPGQIHFAGNLALGSGDNINFKQTETSANVMLKDSYYILEAHWDQQLTPWDHLGLRYGLFAHYQIFNQNKNYMLWKDTIYLGFQGKDVDSAFPLISFSYANDWRYGEFITEPIYPDSYYEYTFRVPFQFSAPNSFKFKSSYFYHLRDFKDAGVSMDYKVNGVEAEAILPIPLTDYEVSTCLKLEIKEFADQLSVSTNGVVNTANVHRKDISQVIAITFENPYTEQFSFGLNLYSAPAPTYFSYTGEGIKSNLNFILLQNINVAASLNYDNLTYLYKKVPPPLTNPTANISTLAVEKTTYQTVNLEISYPITENTAKLYFNFNTVSIISNNETINGSTVLFTYGLKWDLGLF